MFSGKSELIEEKIKQELYKKKLNDTLVDKKKKIVYEITKVDVNRRVEKVKTANKRKKAFNSNGPTFLCKGISTFGTLLCFSPLQSFFVGIGSQATLCVWHVERKNEKYLALQGQIDNDKLQNIPKLCLTLVDFEDIFKTDEINNESNSSLDVLKLVCECATNGKERTYFLVNNFNMLFLIKLITTGYTGGALQKEDTHVRYISAVKITHKKHFDLVATAIDMCYFINKNEGYVKEAYVIITSIDVVVAYSCLNLTPLWKTSLNDYIIALPPVLPFEYGSDSDDDHYVENSFLFNHTSGGHKSQSAGNLKTDTILLTTKENMEMKGSEVKKSQSNSRRKASVVNIKGKASKRRKITSITFSVSAREGALFFFGLKSGEIICLKHIEGGVESVQENRFVRLLTRLNATKFKVKIENIYRPLSPVDVNKHLLQVANKRGSGMAISASTADKSRRKNSVEEIAQFLSTQKNDKSVQFEVKEEEYHTSIKSIDTMESEEGDLFIISACQDACIYITKYQGQEKINKPSYEEGDIIADYLSPSFSPIICSCATVDGYLVITCDVNNFIKVFIPDLWDQNDHEKALLGGVQIMMGGLVTKMFIDEDLKYLITTSASDWMLWDISKVFEIKENIKIGLDDEEEEDDDDNDDGTSVVSDAKGGKKKSNSPSVFSTLELPRSPSINARQKSLSPSGRKKSISPITSTPLLSGRKRMMSIANGTTITDSKMNEKINNINKLFS